MASMSFGAVLWPIHSLFEKGTFVGWSDAQLLERFVAARDDAAFEALVARHGRSVHAVCRDVLRDEHDAEDAFQATFLILARKAGSLWVGDSLAPWLHRVARRVAVEANRQKARRRAVEQPGPDLDTARAENGDQREILAQLLHEEIDRLPEKYRAPIILCDLEDLTRDEASCRLGWPPGTVAGRLARARALLRDRLVRRGSIEPSGLVAIAGARPLARGMLPACWIQKTVRIVMSSPVDSVGSPGIAPAGCVALARWAVRAMLYSNLKRFTAISLLTLLTPAVCALSMATRIGATPVGAPASVASQARHSAPPVGPPRDSVGAPASAASQARATAEGTRGRPEPTLAKGNAGKTLVGGEIVLPIGASPKGVRVLYSTRDDIYSNGHVRAEATVDERGHFSLEIPLVEKPWHGMPGTGTIWAYRPGSLVATIPVYRGAFPPGLPVRLALGPPARAMFEVRGPDDKPVAGARIEPVALDRHIVSVPADPLAALIGAETVTDARGHAVMGAFFPEEVRSIRVKAEGYGAQGFIFGVVGISPDPKVVRLRPTGRLRGRLAGEPDAVRRCPLRVFVFPPPESPNRFAYVEDVATDEAGRFDLPATAAGPHSIAIVSRSDFPWWGRSDGLVEVKPGQTTEVTITLKRAVRVHGLAREEGTKKPIADLKLAVGFGGAVGMTTDRDGRYSGYAPTGGAQMVYLAIPSGYVTPLYGMPQFMIPEGAVDHDLPPVELTRAGEVRGLVVLEHARPAVGAEVEAFWNRDEGPEGTGLHRLTVRTGIDGHFVVPGVPEGTEVQLRAWHRGWSTPEPRSTRTGEAVVLHAIRPSGLALSGRVLDPEGRPIPGAHVHLRSRRRPGASAGGDVLVEFAAGSALIADEEGRFVTPKELDRDEEYTAYASAPGYLTSHTIPTSGLSDSFPVIRLRPLPW